MPPLKINKFTSLKVKFAIFIAISTASIFLFLVIYVGKSQRAAAYSDSKTIAFEVSRKASLETENFFSTAFDVTHELSRNFEVFRNNGIDRKIICQILKKTLEDNRDFLAVWSLWEPNTYDGKDSDYANRDHYDSTGSFLTTYFRLNSEIKIEKNSTNYLADYYTLPKIKRHEIIIDPYDYQYRGYSTFFYETSVVVPLIYNNTFYGVVAVDINLKNLRDKLNAIKIYKTGYVSLISNTGVIVTHPDSSFKKMNVKDLIHESENSHFANIFSGQEKSYELISEFTGKKVLRIIYPINIRETASPWYTMVEIPLSEITERSNQLLFTSLLIMLIGVSLLIYLTINIIERRKYEKVLIEAIQKVEESEKIKTAFLGNISHEIRTPMNGIIGFSELIAHNDTNEEQRQSFKMLIQDACNQLLFIINDILDISVIEAGKVPLRIAKVSTQNIISNLKQQFEPIAVAKGIHFTTAGHDQNNVIIETDELKLVKILSNLISNSIKFTDEGSVEFGYYTDDQFVVFFVSDTGIGIKPENQEVIFESFRQEDSTLNRKYKGTGLGLSISKAFTELLGGKIWFEPNQTKGTTFYLSIPYKPSKQ